MASLKEIKGRISSVRSTQKITAAMKMVSSAKLHRTQTLTENSLRYASELEGILNGLLAAGDDISSPFIAQRPVRTVAIVAFASNSGLCGAYNSNVWKKLSEMIQHYEAEHINVRLFPVGKKIADDLRRAGYDFDKRFIQTAEKLTYAKASELAAELMRLFASKEVDKVELLYHHFKNTAVQVMTDKTYLPLSLQPDNGGKTTVEDFIYEPSIEQLQGILLPKLLNLTIYTTLLDTLTAEHGARMMAMQVADDNANDLAQELTLQYNKSRQQVITNELLDIVGGSMN